MQELDNIFRVLSVRSGLGAQAMSEIGLGGLLLLLSLSLGSSFFIAWLYRYFYSSRSTGSEAHRAFPLLGIFITAIFIAIQFSLPLSLGLLGALSIVRFRTPIKEPEEIGFIMLVGRVVSARRSRASGCTFGRTTARVSSCQGCCSRAEATR